MTKKEYNRQYYTAHKAELVAYARAYYANNRERCCKRERDKHRANPQLHRDSVHRSYRKNIVKRTAYNRDYSKKNAVVLSVKRKEYCRLHKAAIIARNTKYIKANPDKHRAWSRKCYLKNRDKIRVKQREYERYSHKRLRRRTTIKITRDAEAPLLIKKIRSTESLPCNYCGVMISGKTAHIDHIVPISRGGTHTADNLCAACGFCNLSKGKKLLSEWVPPIRQPVLSIGKEGY